MKRRFCSALLALFLLGAVLLGAVACQTNGSVGDYELDRADLHEGNGILYSKVASDSLVEVKTDDGGEYERKIVKTVSLRAETKQFDSSVSQLEAALAAAGGYVQSATVGGSGYYSSDLRTATFVYRIPAESLDGFMKALEGNEGIRITSRQESQDEITSTYYDTVTRLETLKTERDALSAMLAGFTDYKDISAMLNVQERLYDVIAEIESVETKIRLYDSQVSLSTVTVHLSEVGTYTPAVTPSFGERMADAFRDSWADFAEDCLDFAVFITEAFPTLLVLAVLAFVITLIVRASVRRRKKRMAKREQ